MPWSDNHIVDENGCWIWQGATLPNGYGWKRTGQKTGPVHRAYYEHYVGPIPKGLTIDHLCEVKLCVNPEHLEPVTSRENNLRSPNTLAGKNVRKTHCINGHPLFGENLATRTSKDGHVHRVCKKCRVASVQRYRARKRMETGEGPA